VRDVVEDGAGVLGDETTTGCRHLLGVVVGKITGDADSFGHGSWSVKSSVMACLQWLGMN
jgi:hypothetical protein